MAWHLLCLLVLLPMGFAQQNGTAADAAVLMSFRQAASNSFAALQQAGRIVGWQSNLTYQLCMGGKWTGVTCNNQNRISQLNLGGFGITGRLIPELGQLSGLVLLDLSSNDLTGGFPTNWGNQNAMQQLESLSLSNNPRLGGSLQSSWGQTGALPSLGALALNNIGVSGPLPSSWGKNFSLPSLQQLNLNDNPIKGTLPSQWGAFGAFNNLTSMSCHNCSLSGSLPPDWGPGLSILASLDLQNNSLTGMLPYNWSTNSFMDLQQLHLQQNNLGGPLPAAWGDSTKWPSLEQLDLYGNSLSGPVPSHWADPGAFPEVTAINVLPGNPGLCGNVPAGLQSRLVSAGSTGGLRLPICAGPAGAPGPSSVLVAPAPAPTPFPLAPVAPPTPVPAPTPAAPTPVPEPAPTVSVVPAPAPSAASAYLSALYNITGLGSNVSVTDSRVQAQVTQAYRTALGNSNPASITLLSLDSSGSPSGRRKLLQGTSAAANFLLQTSSEQASTLSTTIQAPSTSTNFSQALQNSGLSGASSTLQGVNPSTSDGTIIAQPSPPASPSPSPSPTASPSPSPVTSPSPSPVPAPAPAPEVPTPKSSSGGISGGAIGGIIAGVVIALLAAAGLFLCCCCGKRRQQRSTAAAVRAAKQQRASSPAGSRSWLTFWRRPQPATQDPELAYTRPPPPMPAYAAPTLAASLDQAGARSGAAGADAQPLSTRQPRDQSLYRDRTRDSPGRSLRHQPEPEGLVDVPLDDDRVTFSQRNALFQEEQPSGLVVESANPLAGRGFTGPQPQLRNGALEDQPLREQYAAYKAQSYRSRVPSPVIIPSPTTPAASNAGSTNGSDVGSDQLGSVTPSERAPLRRGSVSHRLSPAPGTSSRPSRGAREARERSLVSRSNAISKHREHSEGRHEAHEPPRGSRESRADSELARARAASLRRALEREYAASQGRRSEQDRPSGSRPAISPAGRSGRERGSSSRDRESRERPEGRQERPDSGSRPSRTRQSAERSVLESRARRILQEIDSMGIQAALREGESRRSRQPRAPSLPAPSPAPRAPPRRSQHRASRNPRGNEPLLRQETIHEGEFDEENEADH